jgi:hypothetical protein
MLVGSAFAAFIAIFDDSIALSLHHLGEAQGFTSKGAMAIVSSMLSVEDADEVQSGSRHI